MKLSIKLLLLIQFFCLKGYSQSVSTTELLNAMLNEDALIKEFNLAESLDTLFIIDCNYLFSGKINSKLSRPIRLIRTTSLNLQMINLEDAKLWKNYIYVRNINECNSKYTIYCYQKYRNKGGSITYKSSKSGLRRIDFSIGPF